MSIDFRSAGHSGDESNHYYRQSTAPTTGDPLQVGDLWSDTTANLLKRCTSIAPVTFVSVEGGSAAHNLFSSTHGDVDETDTPTDGQILKYNSAAAKWRAENEAAGSGESNTASNVNVGGVGVFKQKTGVDLEFRGIIADSSKISVTLDAPNNEVGLDVVEANLTLSNIGGSVTDGQIPAAIARDSELHSQDHAARHADGGADELAVQDLASDAATDGQVAKADGAGAVAFEDDQVVINFIIDGGGSAITTGVKGFIEIPFAMTIEGWTILADQSGSIVVDVWKDTYANFPPVVGDSIAGTEKPTLAAAVKNQDLTLSTWTTGVAAGDILAFNVDSITTIQRVTVAIRGKKT